MKFSYNTNLTLPEQSKRSRSILQDGSRSLGLFWKEKKLCLITEEIWYAILAILFLFNTPGALQFTKGGGGGVGAVYRA